MTKKLDVNDCSFDHLTLILLLHYLVTDFLAGFKRPLCGRRKRKEEEKKRNGERKRRERRGCALVVGGIAPRLLG